MRPSVTDQLHELRRILSEVVGPELDEPYPADILAGACATLEALAAGWQRVPAFLQWDAAACRQLLARLLAVDPELDPHLAARIRDALAENEPAPALLDLGALEEHHRRMRAALESAVPAIAARPETDAVRLALGGLLRERSARYPLTTAWRPAGPSPVR